MIDSFKPEHINGIIDLWNNVHVKDGYKELTINSFKEIFINNKHFSNEGTFVRLDNDIVTGFACGCVGDDLPRGDVSGYITCIILSQEYQTSDNFKELLMLVEHYFREQGKVTASVIFFNPMMLPWYIPGTPGHEHNNAPGAPMGSFFHEELSKNGYMERTVESAMYLALDDFTVPEDIKEKKVIAENAGYEVALFDPDCNFGVEEMLDKLGNPLWKTEISHCTDNGIPVVVASFRGRTVGFAGPVIRQPNGRGYFAGIGVMPEHEGRGLGSLLFFAMCRQFKNIGTPYMSLYTGRQNPAIKIYKKAGFKVVREFAVMSKELKI